MSEFDVGEPEAPRVVARDVERVDRGVGGDNRRARPLVRDGERDRAATRFRDRARDTSRSSRQGARARARRASPFRGAGSARPATRRAAGPRTRAAREIGDRLALAPAPRQREEGIGAARAATASPRARRATRDPVRARGRAAPARRAERDPIARARRKSSRRSVIALRRRACAECASRRRACTQRSPFGGEEPQPPVVVAAPADVLEARLHQHALRRLVAAMRDADDPVETEFVEAAVDDRLRALGREAAGPRLRAASR